MKFSEFQCIEDGCLTIINMNSRYRVIRCGKHARLKRELTTLDN